MNEIETVYKIIEEKFGVDKKELMSKGNTRDMVNLRRIVSLVLLKNTYLNLESIGRVIGRDHSTVSYYKDNTEALFMSDKKLKRHYEEVSFSFKVYDTNLEEKLKNLLNTRIKIEEEILKTEEALEKQSLQLV